MNLIDSGFPIGDGPFYQDIEKWTFNRETFTENLLLLKKNFDERGIKFLLAFGTLLGAIRDGGFIEGDSDTDVIISDEYEDQLIDFMRTQTDFRLMRILPDVVTVGRKDAYIDVGVFRKKRDGFYWCLNKYKIRGWRLTEPEEISFIGQKFLCPKNPVSYLMDKYENWQKRSPQHATT